MGIKVLGVALIAAAAIVYAVAAASSGNPGNPRLNNIASALFAAGAALALYGEG